MVSYSVAWLFIRTHAMPLYYSLAVVVGLVSTYGSVWAPFATRAINWWKSENVSCYSDGEVLLVKKFRGEFVSRYFGVEMHANSIRIWLIDLSSASENSPTKKNAGKFSWYSYSDCLPVKNFSPFCSWCCCPIFSCDGVALFRTWSWPASAPPFSLEWVRWCMSA